MDGDTVYVSLSNAGKVAILDEHDRQVRYVDVAPAGPNSLPHVTAAPLVPEFATAAARRLQTRHKRKPHHR